MALVRLVRPLHIISDRNKRVETLDKIGPANRMGHRAEGRQRGFGAFYIVPQ